MGSAGAKMVMPHQTPPAGYEHVRFEKWWSHDVSGLAKGSARCGDVTSNGVCDALILDDQSAFDTILYIEIEADRAMLGHETTVGKIGVDQLFYLRVGAQPGGSPFHDRHGLHGIRHQRMTNGICR